MSGWKPVTPSSPCAICGKGDWCQRNGTAHHCCRDTQPPAGWHRQKLAEEGAIFQRDADRPVKAKSKRNFADLHKTYLSKITPDRRQRFADDLGVSVDALERCEYGWTGRVYSSPERDAQDRIIGVLVRPIDGKKKRMKGSKCGLTISRDLPVDDLVLSPEGPTDTAALLTLGLSAVGRPSNSGGAKLLADLLRDREVLIVGDNDEKPNGDWPGKMGAISVAQKLANAWNKPVQYALPPAGAKDVRSWLNAQNLDLSDTAACEAAGRDLLAKFQAAAETVKPGGDDEDDGDDEQKPKSQAAVLLDLTGDAELWHCGDDAYATIPVGDHREHWPIRGKRFRSWLARVYHERHGRVCGSQAMHDAIQTIEGNARFGGTEHGVFVRVADYNGNLYLDLCDDEWRVIEITSNGWQIVTKPPVRFRRAKAMQSLPEPVQGGSLDDLRQFVNVASDEDFTLIVSWLIASIRPGRPSPVLGVNGEQGSAKSTASRLLRSLIDPNTAPLRSEPREPRDLAIAANNSSVVALDNLSHISPWLSDCLCRLSTGGGFATRTLYENDEETIFDALRPVLLNGIEEVATKSDLLDRMIRVMLPTIPDDRRRDEDDLYRAFDQAQPRILGAILDAASTGLRNIGSVKLARVPRMADFAKWIVACEPALPWEPGAFMAAYCGNRDAAHELAIEASPVGASVRDFAEAVGQWQGTATELLSILSERIGEQYRKVKGWPSKPNVLSGALRRIAPNLRALGICIEIGEREGRNRTRLIAIGTGTQTSVPIVRSVHNDDSDSASGDKCGRSADACGRSANTDRPPETPISAVKTHADGADDVSPSHSKEEAEAWTV